MKISIKTSELKPILNKLAYVKGVANKQKSLFIRAYDKAECLICDPISSIEIRMPLSADIKEKGNICIPYYLHKMIAAINEYSITISNNKINYGDYVINYVPGNPDNFAILDVADHEKTLLLSVSQEELYRLIKSTFYAVAQDETRPILTGLNINKNKVAALDGYRLAVSESEEFDIDNSITLSEPTVKLLLKLLDKKSADAVTFYITKKQDFVIIQIDNITVTAHLLDGAYIKYESIIPNEYLYKIEIDVKELLKKLKFMFELKKSVPEFVKLTVDRTKLYIENNNSSADIKDSIGINVIEHGDLPFSIAFNPLYLRDALRKYNVLATMQFTTRISPAVIKANNDLDLVLPVRLEKE
ncbi:hypothetical protein AB8U03_13450 [Clostridium sp. Mt-5]|uniref:Beta sliding clamp n=1 Tax=Clostridium moutaii TaxID=3240932 RepID=A0ABV4BU04_9CLOT